MQRGIPAMAWSGGNTAVENVKIYKMHVFNMFITAACFIFLETLSFVISFRLHTLKCLTVPQKAPALDISRLNTLGGTKTAR